MWDPIVRRELGTQLSKRSARDFRNRTIQCEPGTDLQPGIWYRSPLWDDDHCVGLIREWVSEELAWCGRALGEARDWDNEELGGLWYGERRAKESRCATCRRRQKEWDSVKH